MTEGDNSDSEIMEGKDPPPLATVATVKNSRTGTLPSWAISFLAGGIAGTCAKSAIAPLERVKILFQIRHKHYPYSGVFSTVASIFKNEGTIGLWKGNMATVVRIFPYAAIQFLSYETYRKVILFFPKFALLITRLSYNIAYFLRLLKFLSFFY